MTAVKSNSGAAEVPAQKFQIDCTKPVEDGIFDAALFEKFLHDRVKVHGKTGNLGDFVSVSRSGAIISVRVQNVEFSKRYLKYLSKKFLKKQTLRDWLHIVSTDKATYELRYFNVNKADEESSGDEE